MIVTIPQHAVPDLPKDLFAGVPEDVVVVDTGNYYPIRDGRIDAIEDGQVESMWVAEHLGRPVIKAFNNIVFQSLLENGRPEGAEDRIALPVAGDSPERAAESDAPCERTRLRPGGRGQPGGLVAAAAWHAMLRCGPRRDAAEGSSRLGGTEPSA